MLSHLEELGCDIENFQWEIGSINWYDWDGKPRWFTLIRKYEMSGTGKKVGYIEVDIDCEAWNGSENPLGIESIKFAGHGYPCSSIEVAECIDGEYFIKE